MLRKAGIQVILDHHALPDDKAVTRKCVSQALSGSYVEMTFDTTYKDRIIKSLPLFADVNVCTLQHRFTHPRRFLFAINLHRSLLL
jgi:hypothetical protein